VKVLNVEPARYDQALRRRLDAAGEIAWKECADQESFLSLLSANPWEALFVRLGISVDARALDVASKLKWVVTPTTGTDHLDLPLLEKRGVRVISLKGEISFLDSITSTAEHTWALLLSLLRNLASAQQDVLNGKWRREPFLGRELSGLVLGIIGYGRLGRMVAEYGKAFRMRVLINDTSEEALSRATPELRVTALDELLANSDVVSLHLPLNDQTHGFLSRPRIDGIKDGAVLLNTARGELVDDAAVLDALESRRLQGAAVDVLSGDARWGPDVSADATTRRWLNLAKDGRVVVTPHIGGYTSSAVLRTREFVVEKFLEQIGASAGKE
jgi:D-3-phosphoglycerate dehydrogenase